jgi:hypothetical protein
MTIKFIATIIPKYNNEGILINSKIISRKVDITGDKIQKALDKVNISTKVTQKNLSSEPHNNIPIAYNPLNEHIPKLAGNGHVWGRILLLVKKRKIRII